MRFRFAHQMRFWMAGLMVALAGCSLLAGEQGNTEPQSSARPNIVVFVADDMGWNDIGYHDDSGSAVRTPNLDRLAATGVRLEHFYVFPTCSPTRAAFLTGRYPSRYGILGPIGGRSEQALPKDTMTLPARLRQLGYRTAITGKWHLGLRPEVGPRQYGFDQTYGYFHGQVDPYKHVYKNGDRTWHRNDQYVDEEGHVTDLLTAEAIRFLQQHHQRPFFLYVPYSVPHYPLKEEDRWTRPYEKTIENDSRRAFAASESHMDDSIGQICATLDRLGVRDNTLIIFFSDNGGQKSWSSKTEYDGRFPAHDRLGDNRPLRGWKGELYEGGIRVPALVNWRGTLSARTVTDVAGVVDLLPTLVALGGGESEVTAGVEGDKLSGNLPEGRNIWPAITARQPIGSRELYWKTGGQWAVRRGDWKLIQWRGKKRQELYHLGDDPYEKNDLAQAKPELMNELSRRLAEHQALDHE